MNGSEKVAVFLIELLAMAAFLLAIIALQRANHPSQHLGHKHGASYACKLVKR